MKLKKEEKPDCKKELEKKQTRTWLILSIFYKIVDVVSTSYLIRHQGVEAEDNPIVSGMLKAYGPVLGLIINALIFILLMLLLHKYNEKKLLVIATFLQMAVALITTTAVFIH